LYYIKPVVWHIKSFEPINSNNTFDMKADRKLTELRNAAIKRDYAQMYEEGKMRVKEIYKELNAKYFIDEDWLYRIVTDQNKKKKKDRVKPP